MIYLLLGTNTAAKDQALTELKKKIFTSSDALLFDYEVLYGDKIAADKFKQSLLTLPALGDKRLVVIRMAEKLNAQNKKILLEIAGTKESRIDYVMETEETDLKTEFWKQLSRGASILTTSSARDITVFDITNAMAARNPSGALNVLYDLLERGDHPLQLMGGLVWFWGKSKPRLSRQRYREGLVALKEADMNIKRSRLKSEHALELLIVKLTECF